MLSVSWSSSWCNTWDCDLSTSESGHGSVQWFPRDMRDWPIRGQREGVGGSQERKHLIITAAPANQPIREEYSVMWSSTDQSELSIQSGDQWQPGLRLRMSSLQFYINPIIRHNSGANQNVIFHTWKYACVTGVKIICSSLENYWWQNLFRLATNLIISVLKTSICIACKKYNPL